MPLINCPDCGNAVSDAAPSCPKCGRPISAQTVRVSEQQKPIAVYVKQPTSWLTWGCLGLIVLCGVPSIIAGATKSYDRAKNPTSEPSGGGIGNNELQARVAALTPADDVRRAKLIQDQLNLGTIGHIEWTQKSASMLVGAPFYALDMKDKQALALAVWISGVRQSKTPTLYFLTLTDRKNGQEVGQYDEVSGLVMKR